MHLQNAKSPCSTSPAPGSSRGVVVLLNPAKLMGTMADELQREKYAQPPMGLISMGGQLVMHGYDPIIIDFYREGIGTKAAFLKRLRELPEKPLLVGISTYTETIRDALRIARSVREALPECPIVLGGPHATFCYEEILPQESSVDFVVLREGEAAIVELLEHLQRPESLPVSAILGLAYRTDGRVACNEARPFLTHLDALPLPPMHLVDGSGGKNAKSLIFLSSRGCPGQCVFCASRALSGEAFRMHSAERLASMLYLHHRRAPLESFAAMDDTFVANLRRLRAFVSYLGQLGIALPWACKSRVDTINSKTLALLKEAGCKSIHIGPESADDGVLASIEKRITLDRILDALVAMKQHGMRPECSFIIGHHSDTRATIEKTVLLAQAIRDHGIGLAVVGISTPLPGTPLRRRANELGLQILTNDWSRYDLNTPVYETAAFSASDLTKAMFHFEVASLRGEEALRLSDEDHVPFKAYLANFVARAKEPRPEEVSA